MKKVKITCGTYGYRDPKTGRISPILRDNTVDVPDEEAVRLIGLGVAEYVGEESTAPAVATPPAGVSGGGAGGNPPNTGNGAESEDDGAGDGIDADTLDIVDGHFTVDSLMAITRKQMEALAADLEVDPEAIKKCQNKSELAELIAAVEVEVDDESAGSPPALTSEPPVV